jgi:ribosomal protein L33
MSAYRVCKTQRNVDEILEYKKFDNKEDAEHFAHNESAADAGHNYIVQKNQDGEFVTIKSYPL